MMTIYKKQKNICDYVLDDVDTNDVLFEDVRVDDTANCPSPPDPLPSFSDILFPKNKSKNNVVKNFLKKYQQMRQNRDRVKKAAKCYPKTNKSKVYPNDDTQTIIYNDNVNLEDLTTV